jgi:hypothetical protein
VPPNLDETFSSVLEAQADLIQSAAQLGVVHSFDQSPKQMLDEFAKQGDIDRYFAKLTTEAPAVKQAEAKLDLAKINLGYTRMAELVGIGAEHRQVGGEVGSHFDAGRADPIPDKFERGASLRLGADSGRVMDDSGIVKRCFALEFRRKLSSLPWQPAPDSGN